MDDYNISSLQESNNEWVSRLVSVLTPCIIKGMNTIYKEAYQLCLDNEELDKYLMTFQNFLSRIPKWNTEILQKEVEHIKSHSGCDYLEDLITCVHIIQLKALTCIRVGMKHKSIDLDIPKLDQFVHKIYILLARKIYTNVYLFEENIPPLDIQRNNRELEVIIRECIMDAVRDSIPVEQILRSYLDETVEENVETVITTLQNDANKDNVEDSSANVVTNLTDTPSVATSPSVDVSVSSVDVSVPSIASTPSVVSTPSVDSLVSTSQESSSEVSTSNPKTLSFSNIDEAKTHDNTIVNLHAPKDINTLEQKSEENHARRLLEEADGEDYDEDEDSLKISDENVNIQLDVETL